MGTLWQRGDRIENGWEVLEIRQGGMGMVYIVRDHIWGIDLAAKGFQDAVFARDPRVADRFTQEAEVWINLDCHPNIAQAILVQRIQDRPLIFLEFVDSDLAKWINSRGLANDLVQVVRFAIHFCDGITYAYSKGIKAHRDVKPHNCLITSDGILKVTDFGLASVWDMVDEGRASGDKSERARKLTPTLTPTGVGLGTPAYMAPEQFLDARRVDVRADIYAFGITLYEMITGSLPFFGRNHLEWIQFHTTVQIPALSNLLPIELNAMIQRCVEKRPADRFSTFDEVRHDLESLYERLTGKSPPERAPAIKLDSAQWRRKGIGLADLGHLDEALSCFERSLDCDNQDDATWQCKGVILARMGKRSDALICEERAISLDPSSAKAWGGKAVSLLELGKTDEGLKSVDRAIELDPVDSSLWTIKTAILNKLRRYTEAVECSDQGLLIYAHSDTAWVERGEALCGLKQHDKALDCFGRAIEINRRNLGALQGTADILIDLDRLEESIEFLERALRIYPEAWGLWWDKGVALGALKKPLEEELECFSRCVELEPRITNAWYRKGLALHDLGRTGEASECYDRALSLNPEYREALKAKTVALRDLGRADEALDYHERLLKLDPNDATAWNDKGATLCALGRLDQAMECFDRALELDPSHSLARTNKSTLEGKNLSGHKLEVTRRGQNNY
jgi:tetratricopeptide (TPR) repeat protein